MQFFFYCGPDELKELFLEAEATYPIVYEPRFGHIPRTAEVDALLRKPLYSCRDFYRFGRAYRDTPPFDIYTSEDKSRDDDPPNLLRFSGPPVSLTDSKVLCEGSLFLEPENKNDAPRALYQILRRFFAKRFVKTGYCFVSPAVYANRKEYLFIQRDHNFLAPAWHFDDADRHIPTDIDSWYRMNGKTLEQYQSPGHKLRFFAALEDLKKILSKLETQYHLKIIDAASPAVVHTAAPFLDPDPHRDKRTVYLCDQLHRMVLYLEIDTSWDRNGKFSGVSEASAIQNVFGDRLYHDFAAQVKADFQQINEPRYGSFYISPTLRARRRDIVFSFHDPYFRVDENGQTVPVWRKEWRELLAQWGFFDE